MATVPTTKCAFRHHVSAPRVQPGSHRQTRTPSRFSHPPANRVLRYAVTHLDLTYRENGSLSTHVPHGGRPRTDNAAWLIGLFVRQDVPLFGASPARAPHRPRLRPG